MFSWMEQKRCDFVRRLVVLPIIFVAPFLEPSNCRYSSYTSEIDFRGCEQNVAYHWQIWLSLMLTHPQLHSFHQYLVAIKIQFVSTRCKHTGPGVVWYFCGQLVRGIFFNCFAFAQTLSQNCRTDFAFPLSSNKSLRTKVLNRLINNRVCPLEFMSNPIPRMDSLTGIFSF